MSVTWTAHTFVELDLLFVSSYVLSLLAIVRERINAQIGNSVDSSEEQELSTILREFKFRWSVRGGGGIVKVFPNSF